MSKFLLRQYIRALFEEQNHRVASQLISPDKSASDTSEEVDEDADIDVNEFSAVGAGAIVGAVGPAFRKKEDLQKLRAQNYCLNLAKTHDNMKMKDRVGAIFFRGLK